MAFLNSLHKLLNRAGNAVNNDVIHPAQRATNTLLGNQPKPGFTAAPMQHIEFKDPYFGNVNNPQQGNVPKKFWQQDFVPTIPAYQGDQIRKDAQKQYHLTPEFTRNLINANPYVGKTLPTAGLVNKNASAAEYLGNYGPNQIVLASPANPNHVLSDKQVAQQNRDTLVHEGLHRVWDTNPQERQRFAQAYNKGAPASYLQGRVAGYTDAQPLMDEGGVYTNNFKKLASLPPSIQNEIHSYIPEYYGSIVKGAQKFSPKKYSNLQKFGDLPSNIPQGQPIRMPGGLKNYYSQYYRTGD